MDLFTGLQHFYEALDTIKQENEQWNSITSQQVSLKFYKISTFFIAKFCSFVFSLQHSKFIVYFLDLCCMFPLRDFLIL